MGPTEHTRWQLDVALPPEQVLAALVDFSPRREVIWKETCDPAVYRVHSLSHSSAEVTEGVSLAWSRERYDWSEPEVVTLTQLESNIAEPVGTIRYSVTGMPGGGSHITCERYRVFRGPRGRVAGTIMVLAGRWILRSQFRTALDRVGRGA